MIYKLEMHIRYIQPEIDHVTYTLYMYLISHLNRVRGRLEETLTSCKLSLSLSLTCLPIYRVSA